MSRLRRYALAWSLVVAMVLGAPLVAHATGESDATSNDDQKVLYVNANAGGDDENTFKDIQSAIDYVYEQGNKTDWTIEVASGDYGRFVVKSGLDNLTICAADGAAVTVSVADGSECPAKGIKTDSYDYDTGGVIVLQSNDVTIDGIKFKMGEQSTPWNVAAVSTYANDTVKAQNLLINDCTFTGYNINTSACGVFIDARTSSFKVTNCGFSDIREAISVCGDGTVLSNSNVSSNDFKGCSYAIHGYWYATDAQNAGTLTFTDNTLTGSEQLRCKVVLQDGKGDGADQNAVKVDLKSNTLTNALIGLVSLNGDDESVSEVLSSNVFNESSFYVTATQPGTVEAYATYEAPDGSSGRWVLNDAPDDWSEDQSTYVKDAIAEANKNGSKSLSITTNEENKLIETFTSFKDAIYWESYDAGSLSISKSTQGDAIDSKDEFTFKVTLSGERVPTGTPEKPVTVTFDGREYTNGACEVQLNGGESVTLSGIPSGTKYKVEEVNNQGYTLVSFSGATGVIATGETSVAEFLNERTTPTPGDVDIKKYASGLDQNDQTDVTLQIGSTDELVEANVVFVIDKSTSDDVREAAGKLLEDLNRSAKVSNSVINVAVVSFEVKTEVISGTEDNPWVTINDDTLANLKSAIDYSRQESGTNIQRGLEEGGKLLKGVSGSKYLVLITDGITYQWGEGKTIYSESISNGEECISAGNDMMSAHHGSMSAYLNEFNNVWQWYTNHGDDIQSDIKKYEHNYIKDNGYIKADVPGKQQDSTYKSLGFSQEDDDYIPGEILADHYCANDAAVYMTVKEWKSLADSGVKLYAFADVTGDPDSVNSNAHNAKTYPWAPAFISSLNTVAGDSYRIESGDVDGMFNDVRSTIIHAIESGVVNDVIGDDFDLTLGENDTLENVFKLTLNGKEIEVVKTDGNTVYFGEELDNGEYQYSVSYSPATSIGKESLVWQINQELTQNDVLKLTYNLTLVNKATEPGTYTAPTNESACLKYESSNGGHGTECFNKPEVDYTVTGGTIPGGGGGGTVDDDGDLTITKRVTGDQASNADEFAFTITLSGNNITRTSEFSTEDGESVIFSNGTATVTLHGGESITIEDIPVNTSYAVSETDPGDYELVEKENDTGTISTSGETVVFVNEKSTLEPTDPVYPGAEKTLEGRDLVAGEFTFALTAQDGAPMPDGSTDGTATATNRADGSVVFGGITFTEAGTYTYAISEVAGSEEGMTYDASTHTMVVTVADGDGDGKLDVTGLTYDGGTSLPVFANSYEGTEEPPAPEEPSGPGTPTTPVQPTVPDTGDHTSFLPVAAALLGGCALGAAGLVLRRRSGR